MRETREMREMIERNPDEFFRKVLAMEDPAREGMAEVAEYIKKMLKENDPTQENFVATVNLNCKLDLKAIASEHDYGILYDPKSFDALIMRFYKPRTTALISASGKVVCTGAKTQKDAKETAYKVAFSLSIMGYPVDFLHELKIEGVSTGTKKLEQRSYIWTEDGYIEEKGGPFVKKGGKKYGGACMLGIRNSVKRLLVTLGLVKMEAKH